MNLSQIIAQILSRGQVVILPFDTVYGIICDPKNSIAIEKIFSLKNRPANKTLGLAVASLEQMKQIGNISTHDSFIKEKVPGKYTFILPAADLSFSPYCYRDGTVGVRIPNNKLILEICTQFGPIAQTSANKSGLAPCRSVDEVKQQFTHDLAEIGMIVDGGVIDEGAPSTIWDLTTTTPRHITR
jgi:L-threonylcarbamoyladenylate synthase